MRGAARSTASCGSILRWGIEAPGGRGRRGMPSSLITTALLPDQSEVEAILGRSLADDADDSGRDRLTEALHALAEDPRFKQIVDVVQARVDEAFTPAGRKRHGKGSPWRGLADERRRAEEWERDVRRQSDETAGVRVRIDEVGRQLLRCAGGARATPWCHRAERCSGCCRNDGVRCGRGEVRGGRVGGWSA